MATRPARAQILRSGLKFWRVGRDPEARARISGTEILLVLFRKSWSSLFALSSPCSVPIVSANALVVVAFAILLVIVAVPVVMVGAALPLS